MFGYVKPLSGELKVKEYEFYKAVYCGVCRALHGKIKCFAEMTLSYDMVFLALLAMQYNGEKPDVKLRRCVVHPLKKRPMVECNTSLERVASVSALLTYFKVRDNISDSHGGKKLLAVLALPFSKAMKHNAVIDSILEDKIRQYLASLSENEKGGVASADENATLFGNLLGEAFAYTADGESNKLLARECGVGVGRWVYLLDAIDDYGDDIKNNEYNPFSSTGLPSKEDMKTALTSELFRVERSILLTDFTDDGIKNIIYNTIYLGMPDMHKKVIDKNTTKVTE